jgi:hypothetical protein
MVETKAEREEGESERETNGGLKLELFVGVVILGVIGSRELFKVIVGLLRARLCRSVEADQGPSLPQRGFGWWLRNKSSDLKHESPERSLHLGHLGPEELLKVGWQVRGGKAHLDASCSALKNAKAADTIQICQQCAAKLRKKMS